jgi:hypothetical protein
MLLTRKDREIRTLASLIVKALVILYNIFLFFFWALSKRNFTLLPIAFSHLLKNKEKAISSYSFFHYRWDLL